MPASKHSPRIPPYVERAVRHRVSVLLAVATMPDVNWVIGGNPLERYIRESTENHVTNKGWAEAQCHTLWWGEVIRRAERIKAVMSDLVEHL